MYIPGVPDHTCDEITHPFSEITFRAEILDNKKKEAGRQAGRQTRREDGGFGKQNLGSENFFPISFFPVYDTSLGMYVAFFLLIVEKISFEKSSKGGCYRITLV